MPVTGYESEFNLLAMFSELSDSADSESVSGHDLHTDFARYPNPVTAVCLYCPCGSVAR